MIEALRSGAIAACIFVPLAVPLAGAQTTNWISQLGTPQTELGTQVAPDGAGGVFAATSTGTPFFGVTDVLLTRFDELGQQLWSQTIGSSGRDEVLAASSDGAGGFLLSGFTTGDFGGQSAGLSDAWLGRFDASGNQIWFTQLGSTNSDSCLAVASDGAGGAFACGSTDGDLGGPNLPSAAGWLAHFDATGSMTWIRQLNSGASDSATGLVQDGTGGIYACGVTKGDLFGFGGGDLDAWLARFDAGGNTLWGLQWGSGNPESATSVALNGVDGVFVAGNTTGILGGSATGSTDVWVTRISASGNQTWIEQFGSPTIDQFAAAASDLGGGVYLLGTTLGQLGLSAAGSLDSWVARFDGEGNRSWLRQFGTPGIDRAAGLAVAEPGQLFLGGSTSSDLGGPNAGGEDLWVASFDSLLSDSFCTSPANSTGAPAAFTASGSSAIPFNRLDFRCESLPQFAFGHFLCSAIQDFVPNPGGSQGNLCLGGSIGRFVGPGQIQNSGSSGVISLTVDLGSLPQPLGSVSALPGETWSFQAWFRDANPNTTSNFSNGVAVTFY